MVEDPSDAVSSTFACYNPKLPPAARQAVERKGVEHLISSPLLTLEELADLARSAPTWRLRNAARKKYALLPLRSWKGAE